MINVSTSLYMYMYIKFQSQSLASFVVNLVAHFSSYWFLVFAVVDFQTVKRISSCPESHCSALDAEVS